jgi:hypothetical protein
MVDMGDDTEISNVFHKLSCRKSRKKEGLIDREFEIGFYRVYPF